jgi:NADP-dependent aldehyde dehydrogenase
VISSFDPRTAAAVAEVGLETLPAEVVRLCARAAAAAAGLESAGRPGRAAMLRAMADALDQERAALVAIADQETGLGVTRLDAELTRASFQLRFFAEVIEDGAYLEATIDHARSTPMGPRPDLRRLLRPIGPVGVFGASNFPFAFSVPGGDTASALAAGCPVVIKGHEAHPRTSLQCAAALRRGALAAGQSEDVVSLVLGRAAGTDLVRDPSIRAVGFTGSLAGGRALAEVASSRPSPIPFYGELGAVNPLVVCPAAAAKGPGELAAGLVGSVTLGAGQFCTKPGLAFIPAGDSGDDLVAAIADQVAARDSAVMLSASVHNGFIAGSTALRQAAGVTLLAEGSPPAIEVGWWGRPQLLLAAPEAVSGAVLEECFGPVLILVRYASEGELVALLGRVGPALTATVHAEAEDLPMARRLVASFAERVGRIIWNGFPTGVAVAWATHHGGPYPATTDALHTSVGASAIRRWLRPIAYQDLPQALLPPELADDPPPAHRVPRRVDGRLEHPEETERGD